MTTRSTALGILALVTGTAMLVVTDGVAATIIGVSLLVLGLVVTAIAGLRGIHDSPAASQRAAAAALHRDTEASAHMERASETGRWPRVIGGG